MWMHSLPKFARDLQAGRISAVLTYCCAMHRRKSMAEIKVHRHGLLSLANFFRCCFDCLEGVWCIKAVNTSPACCTFGRLHDKGYKASLKLFRLISRCLSN